MYDTCSVVYECNYYNNNVYTCVCATVFAGVYIYTIGLADFETVMSFNTIQRTMKVVPV